MRYSVIRTDTADIGIRKIIMYIARNFDKNTALRKLESLEKSILSLENNPYLGVVPKYPVLKHQGYRVLILDKNLVFYKVDEKEKEVIVYAVVDQRQDYVNIIKGL